ncbi:MAG: AEC family transporter [Desertifilum sp.]|nr:AEC family transporter [Desertifilum sp.]
MPDLVYSLFQLYVPLIGWTALGWLFGKKLPKVYSNRLGKFLFWIGVPISIVAFLRRTDLSGWIAIAPITAWIAILLGAGLAWMWIGFGLKGERTEPSDPYWREPTQGSFLLAVMVGNTGYIGYPTILSLIGPEYFSWALLYDLLGTTIGAYGLGVALAARLGENLGRQQYSAIRGTLQALIQNPALWSMVVGLALRPVALPAWAESGLNAIAWAVISLALVLIGMKLSQLRSLGNLKQTLIALGIKMLLVPLVVGVGLTFFGISGPPHLILVLQMAMPPAFATLVIAEAYNLDRDLTVTSLALGTIGLLFTLPIWILLFG